MGPSRDKRDKLLALQERERDKEKVLKNFSPARFRETTLDNQETLPTYVTPKLTTEISATAPRRRSAGSAQHKLSSSGAPASAAGTGTLQGVQCTSVFRPTIAQKEAIAVAVAERKLRPVSEWALLDTLEVEMYNQEFDQRQRIKHATHVTQRRYLDGQVQQHQEQQRREAEAKRREGALVQAVAAKYEAEEKAAEEKARIAATLVGQERARQVAEAKAERERIARRRAQEEAEVLAEMQRKEAEHRARLAAKVEAAAAARKVLTAENDARIAARREEERLQQQRDEELMQETLRTVEKQEREREEKLKAFHHMIASRSHAAGRTVVAENKARQEKEAEMLRQYLEIAERKAAEKAQRDAARKQQATAAMAAANNQQLQLHAEKAAQEKAESQRLAAEWQRQYLEGMAYDDAKVEAARMRAVAHKREVMGQIQAKKGAIGGDIVMNERERQLNAQLIRTAKQLVGEPRPIAMRGI